MTVGNGIYSEISKNNIKIKCLAFLAVHRRVLYDIEEIFNILKNHKIY